MDLNGASDTITKLSRYWEKFSFIDGILYKRAIKGSNVVQQFVPAKAVRFKIFTCLHDDLGHPGRDRTLSLVQQRFYWPSDTRDIHN